MSSPEASKGDPMLRVGQCEACEAWYLAKNLSPGRVVRPSITARDRAREIGPGIPGYEEAAAVAYFCAECVAAMRDAAGPGGAPAPEAEEAAAVQSEGRP
jgi:hypothetical protein